MISRRRLVHTALALPLATLPLRSTAQARWGRVADAAREMEQLHSLQIAQAGTEVLAEAFRGPGLNRSANIKSVSKTIVATLTGIAIDRGDLPSITATLGEAAAGLIPAAADPRVADLTMEDLVTMRAGLDRTSGANYGSWVSSTNWVANALTRPFVAEPGGRMRPRSLRPRSTSITCSALSLGSASSSSAIASSSAASLPRRRVPAIGRTSATPSSSRTKVSGLAPAMEASSKSTRYI